MEFFDEVRFKMSRSKDKVSDIDITKATHVIILRLFWSGDGEAVDLAEKKLQSFAFVF